MADTSETWDWIIVSGGLAGTVLASRLHEKNPTAKILFIGAGETAKGRSDLSLVTATNLIGGEFDWNYSSAPQQGLDGRVVQSAAGKGLGGGWMRGPKSDYNDDWAEAVGDDPWSYGGQLPYFKKSENYRTAPDEKGNQHGYTAARSSARSPR